MLYALTSKMPNLSLRTIVCLVHLAATLAMSAPKALASSARNTHRPTSIRGRRSSIQPYSAAEWKTFRPVEREAAAQAAPRKLERSAWSRKPVAGTWAAASRAAALKRLLTGEGGVGGSSVNKTSLHFTDYCDPHKRAAMNVRARGRDAGATNGGGRPLGLQTYFFKQGYVGYLVYVAAWVHALLQSC